MNIVDRFLKYVSFCTTSDENTGMTPSTPGQMEFARYLAEELKSIGLTEVSLDSNGYIMATLESNQPSEISLKGVSLQTWRSRHYV
jgi:tripeptide aminopeptidase